MTSNPRASKPAPLDPLVRQQLKRYIAAMPRPSSPPPLVVVSYAEIEPGPLLLPNGRPLIPNRRDRSITPGWRVPDERPVTRDELDGQAADAAAVIRSLEQRVRRLERQLGQKGGRA